MPGHHGSVDFKAFWVLPLLHVRSLGFMPKDTSPPSSTQTTTTSRAHLIVFARLPVEGKVKTRLAASPTIGPAGACRFYQACASHIIRVSEAAASAADPGTVTTSVFHSFGDPTEDVSAWVRDVISGETSSLGSLPPSVPSSSSSSPPPIEVLPQTSDPDLGAKMHHAMSLMASRHQHHPHHHGGGPPCKVLIVGTDVPDLTTQIIDQAVSALDHHQVVLGPAMDGGYYLLGLLLTPGDQHLVEPRLFQGIEWSTSSVLASTIDKCKEAGLSLAPLDSLPTLRDIDTLDDLRSWLQDRGKEEGDGEGGEQDGKEGCGDRYLRYMASYNAIQRVAASLCSP